jgi:hypothetical protein
MLGDVGEDEVGGDGGHLVEARLAELALQIVLGVEAVASEGLDGDVGRLPGGICSQELGQVRLGRYALFWSCEPCLRSVPIVYIWAWAGPALAPLLLTSSRMAHAAERSRPIPPYSSGMSAAR